VLKAAETEISLTELGENASPRSAASAVRGLGAPETCVTIELRQTLNGFYPRFGGYMVRRAAAITIEGALDGLERISG
jgi:hypothetical protein